MTEMSPEALAAAEKALENVATALTFVTSGMYHEAERRLDDVRQNVLGLHSFLTELEPDDLKGLAFQLSWMLTQELVAKHETLDGLIAALEDPDAAVFAGEWHAGK